jgi:hypothetical protein
MAEGTYSIADEWITRVFQGDFIGRDGMRTLLAFLLDRGAECRMVNRSQTLSIYAPVGGRVVRVIAFMTTRGEKQLQLGFADFRQRVSAGRLQEVAKLFSVPGTTNAVDMARKNDFRTKQKSIVRDVLAYPDRVEKIIQGFDLLLDTRKTT